MSKILNQIIICCSVVVTGCASIDFDGAVEGEGKGKGLTYFEPHPHLLVSTGADCVQTVQVVMIPGKSKVMKFNTGFGASTLTATLEDGMITSVGLTSDTKASELLTAAATVATALAFEEEPPPETCDSTASLYVIEEGEISDKPAFDLPPPKVKGRNTKAN